MMTRFQTADGLEAPSVTAAQMREADRLAVEEFGLGILQMMENAGRSLSENVWEIQPGCHGPTVILAGGGGNGGGGLCCARHLHNREMEVHVVLDRDVTALGAAARSQLRTLQAACVMPLDPDAAEKAIREAPVVVDALIGYGLRAAPTGRTAELIEWCSRYARRVLSLDIPSGRDATTGKAPGAAIRPERTLTLALPKIGLTGVDGELYLADIGIPPALYGRLGLHVGTLFGRGYWRRLSTT